VVCTYYGLLQGVDVAVEFGEQASISTLYGADTLHCVVLVIVNWNISVLFLSVEEPLDL